jgi:hypothetical protein
MYAHVDLQLDVGSGVSSSSSSRYIFCLCFLPPTLDPALCFRFKNEVFYSALFCFLLFFRTLAKSGVAFLFFPDFVPPLAAALAALFALSRPLIAFIGFGPARRR